MLSIYAQIMPVMVLHVQVYYTAVQTNDIMVNSVQTALDGLRSVNLFGFYYFQFGALLNFAFHLYAQIVPVIMLQYAGIMPMMVLFCTLALLLHFATLVQGLWHHGSTA